MSHTDAAYIAGLVDGEGTVTLTRRHRQALALLSQTLPWLRSYKRARAELIIRDYVRLTPRNGKYSPDKKRDRIRFENSVLSIKANSGKT